MKMIKPADWNLLTPQQRNAIRESYRLYNLKHHTGK